MNRIKHTHLSFLFLAVLVVSLIPVFHIWSVVRDDWHGVVPEYIEDSYYYYARINDVVRGHPFIGNPYFIEHNDSISPAFFVSDWLASIPFLLKTSFSFGIVFNIIFWSEIFVMILYFLFRYFGVNDFQSSIFSLLTYLQVFWLFVRPVAMQVIFPGYALFLLSLFIWSNDKTNKKRIILLILSSLYCIYVYTYLAQIVFFTFVLILIEMLITRDWSSTKRLFNILLLILTFSIPFLILTYFQVSNPLYPETIHRIGLLSTHIPRMDLFFYGRWVVVVLILWFLSKKWISSFQSQDNTRVYHFFAMTGFALLLTAGSNIVTGKELELSNHIGRFITWWFPLAFFVYLSVLIKNYKTSVVGISLYKKIILACLILLCFVAMYRNIPRAFVFFRMDKQDSINIQNYAGAVNWLKENVTEPSVILASDRISGYVPMMTQHYVLFHPSGALQMVSDEELEDRYLVSRFLSGGASRGDIDRDVALYGGAGKALLGPVMQEHFDDMYKRYKKDIEPNINRYISDFRVSLIVIELADKKAVDQVKKLKIIESYNDEIFVIYSVLP